MTIDELLAEQRIQQLSRLDGARIALEEEARAQQRRLHGGLRQASAAALVRLGIMLDRAAGERAAGIFAHGAR
jgi:hypothetical protein